MEVVDHVVGTLHTADLVDSPGILSLTSEGLQQAALYLKFLTHLHRHTYTKGVFHLASASLIFQHVQQYILFLATDVIWTAHSPHLLKRRNGRRENVWSVEEVVFDMIQDIIVKLVMLVYVNQHVSRNIICKCYFSRIYFKTMKYKLEIIVCLFTISERMSHFVPQTRVKLTV